MLILRVGCYDEWRGNTEKWPIDVRCNLISFAYLVMSAPIPAFLDRRCVCAEFERIRGSIFCGCAYSMFGFV